VKHYKHFIQVLESKGIYDPKIRDKNDVHELITKYEEAMGCMLPRNEVNMLEKEILEKHELAASAAETLTEEQKLIKYMCGQIDMDEDVLNAYDKVDEGDNEKVEKGTNFKSEPGKDQVGDGGEAGKKKEDPKDDEGKETVAKGSGKGEEAGKKSDEPKDDKDSETISKGGKNEEDSVEEADDKDKPSIDAKIGAKISYEGKSAVITDIVDDEGSKVTITFKDGTDKEVETSKLASSDMATDKEEKKDDKKSDKKDDKEADSKDDDKQEEAEKSEKKDDKKEDGDKEEEDDKKEESEKDPLDALKEALDKVALTKAQREAIVSEYTSMNTQAKDFIKDAKDKKANQGVDTNPADIAVAKGEVSPEDKSKSEKNEADDEKVETGAKEPGLPGKDLDGEEKAATGPKDDAGEKETVDKGGKNEEEVSENSEMKTSFKTMFSIYSIIPEEDMIDYVKGIMQEEDTDKVQAYIDEAVEVGYAKKEDDMLVKGENL
jgi:hypothetical protein